LWLGASLIPMYFAQGLWTACISGIFVGVGIAGVTANLDMINSELIEDDAVRSGQRREATYFASISFVTRLSGLVRSGVFFLLLLFFGFESGDNPGDMPATAIRYMISVFPVVLMGVSFLVSCFVKFTSPAGRKDAASINT
jgi:GPH family glycoside/pentoside/hexuronide:cation symporter